MQLQIAIGNQLIALAPGQVVTVMPGQTIRVFYSFNYKVPETISVEVRACLYRRIFGVIDRIAAALSTQTIVLEKSREWKHYQGQIDILIGQVGAGRYGLICEIPKYDIAAYIDNVVEVRVVGWRELIGMIGVILALGVVGMMAIGLKEVR